MSRSAESCVRLLGVVVLALAFGIVRPGHALADVGIGIGKTVCNITTASCGGRTPSSNITVVPGSKLQYNVNFVNDGNVTGPITITDQIQSGQTYLSSSAQCVNSGGGTPLVTCTFPAVGAGSGGTATIQTIVNTGFVGLITNIATGSTPPTLSVPSNQVTVNVAYAPPPQGGPVYYPPNFYSPGCYYSGCYAPYFPPYSSPYAPYYPPYSSPFVQSPFLGAENICGIISEYVPAGIGYGHIVVNGVTLVLTSGLVIDPSSFTLGQSYCVTFLLAPNGVITSLTVGGNLPATNYVCGQVSQYTPGYSIGPAYGPYPGYNSNFGYGPYPGYGPYAGYGPNGGYYGWGGPMVVGGYPYQVAPNTYFPSYPQYGNPYCFMMNQQGSVTGSLSVVPTAATTVEEPSGTQLGKGRGAQ